MNSIAARSLAMMTEETKRNRDGDIS